MKTRIDRCRPLYIALWVVMVVCLVPLLSHAQNTAVPWSSFNMGFASSVSSNTAVKSVVGQVSLGQSITDNTQVESGFLAHPIWRGPVTSVGSETPLPDEFSLQQNYPNPFNPQTTIEYQLPVESKVLLRVYNILGQLAATLVDAVETAGYKLVVWNAEDVPSGIYFFRLETKGTNTDQTFTQVRRMLLVK